MVSEKIILMFTYSIGPNCLQIRVYSFIFPLDSNVNKHSRKLKRQHWAHDKNVVWFQVMSLDFLSAKTQLEMILWRTTFTGQLPPHCVRHLELMISTKNSNLVEDHLYNVQCTRQLLRISIFFLAIWLALAVNSNF